MRKLLLALLLASATAACDSADPEDRSRTPADDTLIRPTDRAVEGSEAEVTFGWKAVPGAQSYELQIATSPGFGVEAITHRLPTAETQLPVRLEEEGLYYWRVIPVEASNRAGTPSESRRITVEQRRLYIDVVSYSFRIGTAGWSGAAERRVAPGRNEIERKYVAQELPSGTQRFRNLAVVNATLRVVEVGGSDVAPARLASEFTLLSATGDTLLARLKPAPDQPGGHPMTVPLPLPVLRKIESAAFVLALTSAEGPHAAEYEVRVSMPFRIAYAAP